MIKLPRSAAFGAAALGLALGLTLGLASSPAQAEDDLKTLAGEAEQAVAAGRTLDALDLAERFSQAVWSAAPLAFRKTQLVDAEPTEFGKETPRGDNVYGVDEEIHIYAEPVAFGWNKTATGFETDMVADVRVSTTDGKIIAGHKAFSEFRIAAPDRAADIFLALTYVFGGLTAGDYVVTTTLHDRIDDKTVAFSTPISIR